MNSHPSTSHVSYDKKELIDFLRNNQMILMKDKTIMNYKMTIVKGFWNKVDDMFIATLFMAGDTLY